MKIAIHHRKGSFSDRWIEYCEAENLNYLVVNCFHTRIIDILIDERVTHLMWHLNHASSKEVEYGKAILNAIDKLNVKTFPDYNTRWHFDNKIAQKYLLESIQAPLVKSDVFFSKKESIEAIKTFDFPIVAKLKRGAGSTNVFLLNNKTDAHNFINKMFDEGVKSVSKSLENIDQKLRVAKAIKNPLTLFNKTINFLKKNNEERKLAEVEKSYFYFQEYLPNNDFDTRVIIVSDKAFAIRRFNKENDFRASGSGKIDFGVTKIDVNLIRIAFNVSNDLNAQVMAFDFIYNQKDEPKIIEISFGFSVKAYDSCEGYWKNDLTLVKEQFNPQYMMIENFIYEQ